MSEPTGAHSCTTCSDQALAVRVLDVDAGLGLALCCGPEGERVEVETALVGPVACGELLLVHAGTAIARVAAGGEAG